MKKLLAFCLCVCLLGCQSQPKEEPKTPEETKYEYHLDELAISNELTELISSENLLSGFKAYNNKFFFEQKSDDISDADQVGRTLKLFEYDLNTQELKTTDLSDKNVRIWDAVYYENHYIYIVREKDSGKTYMVAIDNQGNQSIIFDEDGVGFMGHPNFEVANDGLYYWFYQIIENKEHTKYERITASMERQELWEKEEEGMMSSVVRYKNRAAIINGNQLVYIDVGNETMQDSIETNSSCRLFEDYLVTKESCYDLKTKTWHEFDGGTLFGNTETYIHHNDMIYKNNDNKLYVARIHEGEVESKQISDINFGGTSVSMHQIDENNVLVTHGLNSKTNNIKDIEIKFYRMILKESK